MLLTRVFVLHWSLSCLSLSFNLTINRATAAVQKASAAIILIIRPKSYGAKSSVQASLLAPLKCQPQIQTANDQIQNKYHRQSCIHTVFRLWYRQIAGAYAPALALVFVIVLIVNDQVDDLNYQTDQGYYYAYIH